VAGTGNSSVFRHAGSRAGFSYVLTEFGLRLRERIKRSEFGGRIRTICRSDSKSLQIARPRTGHAKIIRRRVVHGAHAARGHRTLGTARQRLGARSSSRALSTEGAGKTQLTLQAGVVKTTAGANRYLAGMETGSTQSLERLSDFLERVWSFLGSSS
jgi:hypothetical protein